MQILLKDIKFNKDGLVPVIAQQYDTGEVLMMAWMNAEAFSETLLAGRLCYYSRSRGSLWRKGEMSGQTQELVEIMLDCDGDTLLAKVNQVGVACHTGRLSCFYLSAEDGVWQENQKVVVSPEDLYSK